MYVLVILSHKKNKYIKIIAIIWCISVGLFVEFIQGNYIANRSADAYDVLANVIGITLAYFIYDKYINI